MLTYGGAEGWLHSFLTAALSGVTDHFQVPARLTAGKELISHGLRRQSLAPAQN